MQLLRPILRGLVAGALLPVLLGCGTPHGEVASEEPAETPAPSGLSEPSDGPPKHLILLSIDTLRRDALRAYDPAAPEQPHLTAFAARSARFETAVSTAPWTLPAHASLMTGLYPDRHGAVAPRLAIADSRPLLATCFARAGFDTVGLTDGGYVKGVYGFSRGFGAWDDRSGTRGDPHLAERGDPFHRARRVLASRSAAETAPLFLFVQSYMVHDYFHLHPWATTEEDRQTLQPDTLCFDGRADCGSGFWPAMERIYRAEVEQLDRAFGTFLEALDEAGILRDALIVLTSDHGEGFEPERQRIHHGGRLHADQLRVPLLVKGPGVDSGSIDRPVSLVDLRPTLLDVFGIDCDRGAGFEPGDGVSMASLLRAEARAGDGSGEARPVFAFDSYHLVRDGERLSTGKKRRPWWLRAAIDADRWRIEARSGRSEVFATPDLEQRERLPSAPGQSGGLAAALAARAEAARTAGEPPLVTIVETDELRRELEALGYL